MKIILSIALFITVLVGAEDLLAQQIGVIPRPQEVVVGKDSLQIGKEVNVLYDDAAAVSTIQYLRKALSDKYQIYSTVNVDKKAQIVFKKIKSANQDDKERYVLQVANGRIEIRATHVNGFFHGINSLLQMLTFNQAAAVLKIPSVRIADEPAFAWRGFMLDESRHFFGKERVKQLLNWMAFYKLNKFHWHLTDEPAWRLEIKQYPYLTLVGGVGSYTDPLMPAQYYTQEDIQEIIAYAGERFIDVIPEIDMPGHATAANRAYPQFSGGGTKEHPDFTFHPAKEGTYRYLSNILKEANVLFPSNMIHLGGDEVAFGSEAWNTDETIQQFKKEQGYTSNKEVENYFMRRMADSVYAMGAKLLVWDEMADADLPREKTIQYWWRHDKVSQLELALQNGYPTVICPRIPFYFDFVQDENDRYGRKWGKDFNPLERVYQYNLMLLQEKERYPKQILGVQGNLWTERVTSVDKLHYMIFPRIAALAETAWTNSDRKDYMAFQEVVKKHLPLYKAEGIYYYDPFKGTNPEPRIQFVQRKYLDNPE